LVYRKKTIVDEQPCILELLDTAGQEEYATLLDGWIREGQAYILVYNITSRSSFGRVRRIYDQIVCYTEEQGTEQPPIVHLVATKKDLEVERKITTQEGFALAKILQCSFLKVSSSRYLNIEDLLRGLVRDLRKRQMPTAKKLTSIDILKDAAVLSQDRPTLKSTSRFASLAKRFRSSKDTAVDPHTLDVNRQMNLNKLLAKAVRENKRKTTSKLLGLGAEANGDTGEDGSPLYVAAALDHTKLVTLLLDREAAANARSHRGFTPLTIAVAKKHIAILKYWQLEVHHRMCIATYMERR
jgi:GTPase KRas protein